MLVFYFITLFILSILILYFATRLYSSKDKEENNNLYRLLYVASFTMIVSLLSYIVHSEKISLFLFTIYLCSTDILVFELLKFFCNYSKLKKIYEKINYLIIFLIGFDFCSFLLNFFTKHIFVVKNVNILDYNFYTIVHTNFYFIHFLIVYFLASFAFFIVFYSLIKNKGIYRKKYLSFVLSYLIILGVNLGLRFFDFYIDYSVLFYGLLALSIAYFTYHHIPLLIKNKFKNNILDNIDDIIFCFDIETNLVYQKNENKLTNKVIKEIIKEYHEKFLDNKNEIDRYSWSKRVRDNKKIKYLTITAIKIYNKDYQIGSYLIIHDRTIEALREKEENYLLTHDRLTDIYNTEKFCIVAKDILDNNPKEEYYMLCSDIRSFKFINEIYGSSKGDELLIFFANKLKELFKDNPNCVYGRLGRDNFMLMIPKKMYHEGMFSDEYIEINKLFKDNYKIYVNLGIYEIVDRSIPIRIMIDHAYEAIKYNKNNYQKKVFLYDETIRNNIKNEQKIVSEFQEAIKNNNIKMYLQPQVSIEGNVEGAEALARWIDNDNKLISPAKFIPVLEKYGIINVLDKYIWEEACKQLAKWKDNDKYISINISPSDFYYDDVEKILNNLIKKYKIEKNRLRLEITETALMSDRDNRLRIIESIKKQGFIVEMDDFGSGYSSLSFLKNVNFDIIKIDMNFLMDNDNKIKSQYILGNIIDLCKKLGMSVVTEGVENKEQVEFLTKAGCDFFQGYYFDRPMSVTEFEKKHLINKGDLK